MPCHVCQVVRLFIEDCQEQSKGELLELILDTLLCIPVILDSIKDSQINKCISKLQESKRTKVKELVQRVMSYWENTLSAMNVNVKTKPKKSRPVEPEVCGLYVCRFSVPLMSMFLNSTIGPCLLLPFGLNYSYGYAEQEVKPKRLKVGEESKPSSSTEEVSKKTQAQIDIEEARKKRDRLRDQGKGRGGGVQLMDQPMFEDILKTLSAMQQPVAPPAPAPLPPIKKPTPAKDDVSSFKSTAAPTPEIILPKLESFREYQQQTKKAKKKIRWADKEGGELEAIKIVERYDWDEGEERPSKRKDKDKEDEHLSVQELMKKEKLAERQVMQQERAAHEVERKQQIAQQSATMKPRIAWRVPKKVVKPEEEQALAAARKSDEAELQSLRLKRAMEVRYMSEADIPLTPDEENVWGTDDMRHGDDDVPSAIYLGTDISEVSSGAGKCSD